MHRDASVIYRCVNPARELRSWGHQVAIYHSEALPRSVTADLVIFHRPYASRSFSAARRQLAGSAHWCDLDDLLFGDDALEEHPAMLSGTSSISTLYAAAQKSQAAISQLDGIVTSTDDLATQVRQIFTSKPCVVVRNGWSEDWRAVGATFAPEPTEKKIISYFAGTRNHLSDLKICATELDSFVRENTGFQIDVYGSINPEELGFGSERWHRRPAVAFFQLPSEIRRSWVTVAPLRDTPFNRCKSAIKFIESGLFARPLIASPLPEFDQIETNGVRIARSSLEWRKHLGSLLADDAYQEACSTSTISAEFHSASNNAKQLNKLLEDVKQ